MSSQTCDVPKLRKLVESAPSLPVLQRNVLQYLDNCAVGERPPEIVPEVSSPATPKKKKRAPSERNKFMGECMRKPENGGQGRNMSDCSTSWQKDHPKKG